MILWIVGMMGSGKSTVGLLVAKSLGVPFHDTDTEVEALSDLTVAEIWEQDGEKRFPELEAAVITTLAASNDCVVSTGGGVVLSESNGWR